METENAEIVYISDNTIHLLPQNHVYENSIDQCGLHYDLLLHGIIIETDMVKVFTRKVEFVDSFGG